MTKVMLGVFCVIFADGLLMILYIYLPCKSKLFYSKLCGEMCIFALLII